MLFGVIRDALSQFLGMGQKEVEIKPPRLGEHLGGCRQIRSFAGIDASLFAFPAMECELRCPCGLSHLALPLLRTEVLHTSQCRMLSHLCQAFWKVGMKRMTEVASTTLSSHLKGYIPLSRFWETVPYGELKHEPTITAAQCDDSNSSIRFLPCLRQKFSLVFPLYPHRMSSERTDQRQQQEAEPGWLALH